MPSSPPASLNNWWCDRSTEYGFVGFSYEVSACTVQVNSNTFKGRYVRMYGSCSKDGVDDVVTAAWEAGIGVHALIWFGFVGGDEWKGRRDALLGILHSNPKAKYVTRALQFGSSMSLPDATTFQAQRAGGIQEDGGEQDREYLTENGWPSVVNFASPNSPSAVASVQNEHDYYSLLDAHCSYFKAVKGGGVGWFWHIYSDDMEPGYGLFDKNGKQKFPFSPKTSC
ncbi:hypothetical protein DFH06DRAFT_1283143 [Mycena polygramma]|nr:hypothetical protein DFH06DRAFT_1283143 [Mycena polygramma]